MMEDRDPLIKVHWMASKPEGSDLFTLEELQCDTIDSWSELDDFSQHLRLRDALAKRHESSLMPEPVRHETVDSFTLKSIA